MNLEHWKSTFSFSVGFVARIIGRSVSDPCGIATLGWGLSMGKPGLLAISMRVVVKARCSADTDCQRGI